MTLQSLFGALGLVYTVDQLFIALGRLSCSVGVCVPVCMYCKDSTTWPNDLTLAGRGGLVPPPDGFSELLETPSAGDNVTNR